MQSASFRSRRVRSDLSEPNRSGLHTSMGLAIVLDPHHVLIILTLYVYARPIIHYQP